MAQDVLKDQSSLSDCYDQWDRQADNLFSSIHRPTTSGGLLFTINKTGALMLSSSPLAWGY